MALHILMDDNFLFFQKRTPFWARCVASVADWILRSVVAFLVLLVVVGD